MLPLFLISMRTSLLLPLQPLLVESSPQPLCSYYHQLVVVGRAKLTHTFIEDTGKKEACGRAGALGLRAWQRRKHAGTKSSKQGSTPSKLRLRIRKPPTHHLHPSTQTLQPPHAQHTHTLSLSFSWADCVYLPKSQLQAERTHTHISGRICSNSYGMP